jgi:cytochrome c553
MNMYNKIMRSVTLAGCFVLAVPALANAAGDAAAGKDKSSQCTSCHGVDGKGLANNPAIAGKPEGELLKSLMDYKTGANSNMMMGMVTKKLSDEDLADLAAYYASLE